MYELRRLRLRCGCRRSRGRGGCRHRRAHRLLPFTRKRHHYHGGGQNRHEGPYTQCGMQTHVPATFAMPQLYWATWTMSINSRSLHVTDCMPHCWPIAVCRTRLQPLPHLLALGPTLVPAPISGLAATPGGSLPALLNSCHERTLDGIMVLLVAHSSSGPGRRPLKAEITGSSPVCATTPHHKQPSRRSARVGSHAARTVHTALRNRLVPTRLCYGGSCNLIPEQSGL